MAKLDYCIKLREVEIIESKGRSYYDLNFPEKSKQAKAILSAYGITLSDYQVIFNDNKYQTEIKSGYFGRQTGIVVYKDTVIARSSMNCGRYYKEKGKLIVYLFILERVYEWSNTNLDRQMLQVC